MCQRITHRNWWRSQKRRSAYRVVDGVIKGRLGNAAWFTNLDHAKRHKFLKLGAKYKGNEEEYPTYDNYDAINVNRVADIPRDWTGVMGVPIYVSRQAQPRTVRDTGCLLFVGRSHNEPYLLQCFQEMRPDADERLVAAAR